MPLTNLTKSSTTNTLMSALTISIRLVGCRESSFSGQLTSRLIYTYRVSGVAKISQDRELIKKHWHASSVLSIFTLGACYWSCFRLSAWFGDLKDGVHKGDENDPRISLIRVVPDEIRYFKATRGAVGRAVETGINAFTHGVSTPGELITITSEEVRLPSRYHA